MNDAIIRISLVRALLSVYGVCPDSPGDGNWKKNFCRRNWHSRKSSFCPSSGQVVLKYQLSALII